MSLLFMRLGGPPRMGYSLTMTSPNAQSRATGLRLEPEGLLAAGFLASGFFALTNLKSLREFFS